MIRAPSGTNREVITAFVFALKSLDQLNRSGTRLGLLAKPTLLRRDHQLLQGLRAARSGPRISHIAPAEQTVFRLNLVAAR